jgi:hypothetical protein
MYIRPKFGQRAGEVQFLRPDVARALVECGRATDPRFEVEELASGGIVERVEPVIVGDHVTGGFLPASVVDKMEALAALNKGAAGSKTVHHVSVAKAGKRR